jgi:hypothetical protein
MQLLTMPDTSHALFALAALAMLFVLIAIPVAGMHAMKNRVEIQFDRFEYHLWHRNASPLLVRFLNVILLPVGSWEPAYMRNMLWMFVTRQCRREYLWLTLPMWSPLVVACLGVIRPATITGCVILFSVLAVLHLIIALVVVWFRPLQSTLEDCIFVLQTFLSAVVLSFSGSLLLYPASALLRSGMVVLAFLTIVVTCFDVVYNVFLMCVVLPRLHDHVPHTVAFEWPYDPNADDGKFEMDSEMRERQRVFDLYGDDDREEPLLLGEGDPMDNDEFLDMLMVGTGDAPSDQTKEDNDKFLDDLMVGN